MPFSDDEAASHHLAVVVLPHDCVRADVRAELASAGIQTSVHYPPIHEFSAFSTNRTRPLPNTEAIGTRLLTLPLYPHMTPGQVDTVAEALVAALKERAPTPD